MTPYNYSVPVYYYIPIPVDDKETNLTGPQFAGLIVFLVILAAWALATILLFQDLMFDDNKQDKKRHTIELIVLIAIGIIGLFI